MSSGQCATGLDEEFVEFLGGVFPVEGSCSRKVSARIMAMNRFTTSEASRRVGPAFLAVTGGHSLPAW